MTAVLSSLLLALVAGAPGAPVQSAGTPVFSGPQPGEPLPACPATRPTEDAPEPEDFARAPEGTPLFLVVVHQRTRPALGLVQLLTGWAADRPADEDGSPALVTRVVWLDDDRSAARAYLTAERTAPDFRVPVGIAVDGGEGPGAYGLNRDVVLTLLVARDRKVLANFALTAPSDTDALPVLAAVARALGAPAPEAEELARYRQSYRADPRAASMSAVEEEDSELWQAVLRLRSARLSPEEVARHARAVEALVADDPERRRRLQAIARAAVARDDFERLGTEAARARVRAWLPSAERGTQR